MTIEGMSIHPELNENQLAIDWQAYFSNRSMFKNVSPNINVAKNEIRGWKYSRSVHSRGINASISIPANTLAELEENVAEFRTKFDSIDSKGDRAKFINWYRNNRAAIKAGRVSPADFSSAADILEQSGVSLVLNFKTYAEAKKQVGAIAELTGIVPSIVVN